MVLSVGCRFISVVIKDDLRRAGFCHAASPAAAMGSFVTHFGSDVWVEILSEGGNDGKSFWAVVPAACTELGG